MKYDTFDAFWKDRLWSNDFRALAMDVWSASRSGITNDPPDDEVVAAAQRASEAQRLKEDCANLNGENPDSAVFSTIYAKTEEYVNPHVIGEFQTVFEENQRFADNIVKAYRNDKASGIL